VRHSGIATGKTPVEALHRGLQIIEILHSFGGGSGISLMEISRQMGLNRSTVHNLLKTLVMCGYAENVGEGRYRLSGKLRRMAHEQVLNRISRGQARGVLAALAGLSNQVGEALVLTALVNGRRRVLARALGNQTVRVSTELMESDTLCIWRNVTGRVLAAYASADDLVQVFAQNSLPLRNWGGMDNEQAVAAALTAIRAAGHSSEVIGEVFALAVPVLDRRGQLLAAVGIFMPLFRHSSTPQLLETLQRGATELAEAMRHDEEEPLAAATDGRR
jgi:IclR family acetate operon transcriptional repressor